MPKGVRATTFDRTKGIGGSDAAAACGLDPWRSQVELWLEKTGRLAPREESEAMAWGTKLQPLLLTELGKRVGHAIRQAPLRAERGPLPFLFAHPDGYCDNPRAVAAIKTTGRRGEWDDEIPHAAMIQTQHYLVCTDRALAFIGCLIAGQRFVTYEVPRDDRLIAAMLELEERFWHHVETDTPPAPDGSDSAGAMMSLLYPNGGAPPCVLTASDAAIVEELHALKRAAKSTERQIAEREQALKARLGDAEVGLYEAEPLVKWTTVRSDRVDVKALRAARPEIAAEFTTESVARRFTLGRERDA